MKYILSIIILLCGILTISAQNTQTKNEFYLGYQFIRQDVELERPNFTFNQETDTHGVNAGYTRYFSRDGVAGITGELGASFKNSKESLVTALGGVTLKARKANYIQPYVRALGGVARQRLNSNQLSLVNLNDADTSLAFALGGGADFNLAKKSRYKLRVGADWLSTEFNGARQNNARVNLGIVF